MVRFADDFVMGFARREDAVKVQRVIEERFARFGLKINAEKTRLVPCQRPPYGKDNDNDADGHGPGTFDFLGFTLHWGKTRRRCNVVQPRTARSASPARSMPSRRGAGKPGTCPWRSSTRR